MKGNLKILDCTLRDGGYCNNWNFGYHNIKYVIRKLMESKINLIECGILSDSLKSSMDNSIFSSVRQVEEYIEEKANGTDFLMLMNYDEYDVDKLPPAEETILDGIRVAFHKKNMVDAYEVCEKIKERGYKIYPQPMVTNLYSEEELTELIHRSNRLQPEALYIVDSFGAMTESEVERLFAFYNAELDKNISIGFHSHNNLMLSLSNSMMLVKKETTRPLIVDSSVLGMGRGAGNLHTEVLLSSLKDAGEYHVKPIYSIIDQVVGKIKEEHPWGYSGSYFLSAIHHCHPNYAKFLLERGLLTVGEMNEIFMKMDKNKKTIYDETYISEIMKCLEGKR